MSKRKNRAARRALVKRVPSDLYGVDGGRGWMTVYDSCTDPQYWQKDMHPYRNDADRNWTVFACKTLIAGDMGKMSPLLMQPRETDFGPILERATSTAFSPVLRKPNGFQTWPQFMQYWLLSKLGRGNTYALKGRDNRNVVTAMYVLDPDRVTPLVAESGDVYYELKADPLAQVPEEDRVVVPADEIIHDRMNCLFHPLVGLSPLYASALSASQGLTIQEQSASFFRNASRPSGILVSPQIIQDNLAEQYSARWKSRFGAGGTQAGGVAVLGNGLKYEPITMNAVDAELVKQLDMTAQHICSTFHVPGYKVGVGIAPTYQNAEVYDQIYYDSCLQVHATDIEALFDDGLGLTGAGYVFKFDLEDLIKMDSATMTDVMSKQVAGSIRAPNEARAKFNLPPAPGGNSPMSQQQNWSLEQLAERDSPQDAASVSPPAAAPAPAPAVANDNNAEEDAAAAAKEFLDIISKGLEHACA